MKKTTIWPWIEEEDGRGGREPLAFFELVGFGCKEMCTELCGIYTQLCFGGGLLC